MSIFKRKKTEEKKDEQLKKSDKIKIEKNEKVKNHGLAYKNLVRPIITEKVTLLGAQNQYVFEIAPKSNKVEIKKAIQSLYGVIAEKVNIINIRGKITRYGRSYGKRKNWKKAVVTLKQGDKIEVYEGV